MSPLLVLSLISFMVGIFMLLVFGYVSDQQKIRQTKNGMKAHLLELWLFRHEPMIMLSAQMQLFRLNGRYLKLAIRPVAILIAPLALLLLFMEGWFAYRPLHPGETAIVSVQARNGAMGVLSDATLHSKPGVTVETPALRIASLGEINWRIRADSFGEHTLRLKIVGQGMEKPLLVSDKLVYVDPPTMVRVFWSIFSLGALSIRHNSPVEFIEIHYPARAISILGWQVHWITVFLVVSILSAFVFKGWLRVEI